MSGIRKKFLFQLIYAFSQLAFPLITYPYITRALGAEGLGLVGYVEYLSGFIITLAAFGIPFYGVREAAKLQDEPQKRKVLFSELFSLHLFLSLVGCGIFIGLLSLNARQDIPSGLLLLGCVNILLPAFIAEWYLQGMEAFAFITIRSIVLRFFGLIAIFLFVSGTDDAVMYYLIIIAVQAGVALTNFFKIGSDGVHLRFWKTKHHLKPLVHFFLSSSVISIYVFFDVIILGWLTNEAQVGFYAVSIKIIKLSLLAVLSLNVILFPRIAYLSQQKEAGIKEIVQKAMQYIMLIAIPMMVGFLCLAPQIIAVLAGDEFIPSVILVQVLSALPLIIGFSNLFVYQILTPFGREKKLLRSVLIACAFSVVLHLVLVARFNALGSAIATTITELTVTLLTGYFAYQTLSFRFPVNTFLQSLLASLPIIALAVFFRTTIDNPIIVLVIVGGVGMLVYTGLQFFVFKNSLLHQMAYSFNLKKRKVHE